MWAPVSVTKAGRQGREEAKSELGQSLSTTADVEGFPLVSDSVCVAALETGASADLARFRWHEYHNRILERTGYQKVPTFPSSAQFRFGNGHPRETRNAA